MLKQNLIRIVKAKLLLGIFAIFSGLSLAVLTSNNAKADLSFEPTTCDAIGCVGSGVNCCRSEEGIYYKYKEEKKKKGDDDEEE